MDGGWFVAAVAMSFVDSIVYFILVAGIAFLGLMLLPGAAMLNLSRKTA